MKYPVRAIRPAVLAALLVGAALARPVVAAPVTYAIDPDHSSVTFGIRHMLGKVHGQFDTFSGTVVLDPAKREASTVTATIDASSIDTNKDRRDAQLKGADFFEVEKYPTLTFQSKTITWKGDTFTMVGDLTMHGVTRPVTFTGQHLGMIERKTQDGGKAQLASFTARGTLDRTQYGIVWNRALDNGTMLGSDVDFELDVEAVHMIPGSGAPSSGSGTK